MSFGQDRLFVTYAKRKGPDNHDDQEGPGNGFIDEYDTTGHFIERFATGSAVGGTDPLNSPIGMTVAPAGFGPSGKFGGALLVGNFGDSHVSAFDLNTGQFLGQLSDAQGNPLTLNGGVGGTGSKGLWGIAFGNGHGGNDPNALYFASGINDESDGLFGKVTMGAGHHEDHDLDDMHHSMPSSNGTPSSGNHGSTATPIDTFFQMLDGDLLSLESTLLSQKPNLEGMIQSFNALATLIESTVAGHPIEDLSGHG